MATDRLRWVYTGIRVRQLARSIRFYRMLGFRETRRGEMGHGGRWVDLKLPGSSHGLELNFYPKSSRYFERYRPGSEFDHLGFRVGDVPAWVRRLRRLEVPVVADVTEANLRLMYVRDPDGNWVELYGPVRARSTAAHRR